jgi:hypothetical protein
VSQFNAIAVKLTFKTAHASASGGPSSVTHDESPLFLTTSLPPLFMIFPSMEPSTTTVAPSSIVKSPRIFPRTCKEQFFSTIVSLSTEPCMSDELLTNSGPSMDFCAESIAAFDMAGLVPHTAATNTCAFPAVPQQRFDSENRCWLRSAKPLPKIEVTPEAAVGAYAPWRIATAILCLA